MPWVSTGFNPRRPRGRRRRNYLQGCRGAVFQSTPPARAATLAEDVRDPGVPVSIHAAREGGDTAIRWPSPWPSWFQSTPPARAATLAEDVRDPGVPVSIHAAREGGDPAIRWPSPWPSWFQSTPPARAATPAGR